MSNRRFPKCDYSASRAQKALLANDHAQWHDRKIKLQELPKSLFPTLRRRNFARQSIVLIGNSIAPQRIRLGAAAVWLLQIKEPGKRKSSSSKKPQTPPCCQDAQVARTGDALIALETNVIDAGKLAQTAAVSSSTHHRRR